MKKKDNAGSSLAGIAGMTLLALGGGELTNALTGAAWAQSLPLSEYSGSASDVDAVGDAVGDEDTPAVESPAEPSGVPVDLLEPVTVDVERQRRLQQYLQSLRETSPSSLTLDQLRQPGSRSEVPQMLTVPSLGSALFDAQLMNYVSYLETVGTPDILIVGSSRALQGIDPNQLQATLTASGYGDLKIYNFSVNGATAQVVNFILSELLPGPLPAVIVWGDGSRAFNAGRRDRTWEQLTASPGYSALQRGDDLAGLAATRLAAAWANDGIAIAAAGDPALATAVPSAAEAQLNALGFSPVLNRFDPTTYYRQFPRVAGQYDGAYSPFLLTGSQSVALDQLASYLGQQQSQLIFVNLPLSDSYLDDVRLYYESEFQRFMSASAEANGFAVVDMLRAWPQQPENFADPSHINAYGAADIAQRLAAHPILLGALGAATLDSLLIEELAE